MVFVDANIFMYAVGGEHPHKMPSLKFFESALHDKKEMAISVEVLQEILYRFWAIKKPKEGFQLFEYAQSLSNWILPVSHEEIRKAKDLMSSISLLSPRDALHVATMLKNRISTIISYDQGFDEVKEIKRIEP